MSASPEIHAWIIDTATLPEAFFTERRHWLSAAEHTRLQGMSHAETVRIYRNARVLVRLLLSRQTGLAPEAIPIAIDPQSRPFIDAPNAPDFNLSHSGEHVMLALGQNLRLGVDIEAIIDRPLRENVITRHFSEAEQRDYHSLPARQKSDYFFTLWTLKEARAKASGDGLRTHFKAYDFADGTLAGWHCHRAKDARYHAAIVAKTDNGLPPVFHLHTGL